MVHCLHWDQFLLSHENLKLQTTKNHNNSKYIKYSNNFNMYPQWINGAVKEGDYETSIIRIMIF